MSPAGATAQWRLTHHTHALQMGKHEPAGAPPPCSHQPRWGRAGGARSWLLLAARRGCGAPHSRLGRGRRRGEAGDAEQVRRVSALHDAVGRTVVAQPRLRRAVPHLPLTALLPANAAAAVQQQGHDQPRSKVPIKDNCYCSAGGVPSCSAPAEPTQSSAHVMLLAMRAG
jgi:hypothetical protein